jgi:hypothetical protein
MITRTRSPLVILAVAETALDRNLAANPLGRRQPWAASRVAEWHVLASDRPLDDHLATFSAGQVVAGKHRHVGVRPRAEAGSISRSSGSRVVESLQWIYDYHQHASSLLAPAG